MYGSLNSGEFDTKRKMWGIFIDDMTIRAGTIQLSFDTICIVIRVMQYDMYRDISMPL